MAEVAVVSPKRVNVRLDDDLWEQLKDLAEREGITMSERLAALAALWATDPEVRTKGDERARQLAVENRKRRYGPKT